MSDEAISIEKLQELIMRGPFNQWLNFTTVSAGEDGVEIKAAWREEWVVHPERRYTHGGILAAIVANDKAESLLGVEPFDGARLFDRAFGHRHPICCRVG